MIKSKFYACLFLVAVSFAVVSCGDDDSEEVTTPVIPIKMEELQGTWNSISRVVTGCPNSSENETIQYNCPDFCYSYTFNSDGTFTNTQQEPDFTIESSGKFTIKENIITICEDNEPCFDVVASIENNQLILLIEDDNQNGCMTTITFSKV